MKIKVFLLLWLIGSGFTVLSQNFDRVVIDDNGGSTDYYLAVRPRGPIDGVLVLFPGFGDAPENVLSETKLHNTAYANNILTLIIPYGPKLYLDKPTLNSINRALEDSIKRFEVNRDKFVIGGFSAGGTISLRYVEMCKENPSSFPVSPKAVFTIDSPVDLVYLWEYFNREVEKNFSQAGTDEARFIQPIMEKDLLGTPVTNLQNYIDHSPFYFSSIKEGNEKFLQTTPVRVYHDMDVVWQLRNRRRSLLDNNAFCSSELINRLLLMGNDRAEFIQSQNPGYRSNGMRHTHSWSIVDEVEFIQWMKGILKS